MKLILTYLLALITSIQGIGQEKEYYTDSRERTHLIGPFSISDLQQDTNDQEWFTKNYSDFDLTGQDTKWGQELNDIKVDILMGTWCGDSKKWVPQFIKL